MMSILVEVCIDSLESLPIAQNAGAQRIELCCSLATGGLTPSAGYMRQAAKIARIPVYAIIRPREGDFLYSSDDIEIMLEDIHTVKRANLQGIAIGALHQNGDLNQEALKEMVIAAKGLGVTFHRAIDHCRSPFEALEVLMSYKVERVLTSGLAKSANEGIKTLKEMTAFCGERLRIMPGAGVSPSNVKNIIAQTNAKEIHLSGKTTRPSQMQYHNTKATLGANESDFDITVTSEDILRNTIKALKS